MSISMPMALMPMALMHDTHAAPHAFEVHRFCQLLLDIRSAPAYPLLGRDHRSSSVDLIIKSEERVVAFVERPGSRIWDRHGGDGLQFGADDVVAEVVELRVNSYLLFV
jgi:hypothetical protein